MTVWTTVAPIVPRKALFACALTHDVLHDQRCFRLCTMYQADVPLKEDEGRIPIPPARRD